jgi:hypothetical protein
MRLSTDIRLLRVSECSTPPTWLRTRLYCSKIVGDFRVASPRFCTADYWQISRMTPHANHRNSPQRPPFDSL